VQGYAGGIVCGWNRDLITVDVCKKQFQYIHLRVRYPNNEWWFFTPVYASPHEPLRATLWDDLKELSSTIQLPWLVAGDFNDIISVEEKKGGSVASTRKCNIFRDRINACKLIDIGAMGARYTWRGPMYHGGQRIYERLDRALCNDKWSLSFPNGFVKVLPRVEFSDHHPILISPKEAPHLVAPKQFRFESAWLLEKTYKDMMEASWRNGGTITDNLSNVERVIKDWKYYTIDQVLHQKREITARIGGIQNNLQRGLNRGGLIRLEKRPQDDLSRILQKEELMWYQRSRAKWLVDGDRNTRYYHLKTVNRRRRNNVFMLTNDSGEWVEDVGQIHNLASRFYKKLFSNDQGNMQWHTTSISYPTLDMDIKIKLAAPITTEEVRRAVFSMHPWKAPGPDGFPAGFYQKSWDVVGETVVRFVESVWHNPSLIEDVNKTDICLIPKVDSPEYVTQFIPISLCNTNYKIVSKVIVERLKECIATLISPFQTGFVPGRNIHENIVIAKEMAHTMHFKKGKQ
jgi:hypothetical protein